MKLAGKGIGDDQEQKSQSDRRKVAPDPSARGGERRREGRLARGCFRTTEQLGASWRRQSTGPARLSPGHPHAGQCGARGPGRGGGRVTPHARLAQWLAVTGRGPRGPGGNGEGGLSSRCKALRQGPTPAGARGHRSCPQPGSRPSSHGEVIEAVTGALPASFTPSRDRAMCQGLGWSVCRSHSLWKLPVCGGKPPVQTERRAL